MTQENFDKFGKEADVYYIKSTRGTFLSLDREEWYFGCIYVDKKGRHIAEFDPFISYEIKSNNIKKERLIPRWAY